MSNEITDECEIVMEKNNTIIIIPKEYTFIGPFKNGNNNNYRY